jgi:hypothetical protein
MHLWRDMSALRRLLMSATWGMRRGLFGVASGTKPCCANIDDNDVNGDDDDR